MDPNKPIRTIMTELVTRVSPETSIKDIEQIFAENDFHHLPVVEYGLKLVGMISKSDFEKFNYWLATQTTGKTWTEKKKNSMTAAEIMKKSVMSLDPDDSIGLAADIFLANKFHALPIIEDNILQGILTTHDLLKYSFDSPVEYLVDDSF